MDRRFLLDVCDAYLVDHNVYSEQPKKIISQVREKIVDEVLDLVHELRETDVELYDQLWDRTKLDQQQIIKTYLDYCYEEEQLLNEDITTIVSTGMLAFLVSWLSSGQISKTVFRGVEEVGKWMEGLAGTLRRQGRYFKFRYAIIQRNVKRCYTQCGVEPKDIGFLTYTQLKHKGSLLTTQEAVSQGKCLRKCYIEYAIAAIALKTQNYFSCLRYTGAFDQIENIRDNELLTTITSVNLSSTCKSHFDDAKESFSRFNDLLDFVYGNNSQKKQEASRKLQTQLVGAKRQIKKVRNLQQINPKYRKRH